MTEASANGALHGVTVVDLTRILAGPWCTQFLGDMGADVIKIERPDGGDDTRAWGPPFLKSAAGEDSHEAAYYLSANRNKRSLAIDIASAEGQAIILNLVKRADVVIENFKVGQLKRYGLDYESLKAIKPDLIYCSITGFGQTGPWAQRAGYDFIVQGIGGFMSVTGERDDLPGGGPQKAGVVSQTAHRRRSSHRRRAARCHGGYHGQHELELPDLAQSTRTRRQCAQQHRALPGVPLCRWSHHLGGRQ
jgi:crotonobetainyl-CoA:carnitine CoA-transferase CaiB-like acyl-CoA transferase